MWLESSRKGRGNGKKNNDDDDDNGMKKIFILS
jgi:hypothetical protein